MLLLQNWGDLIISASTPNLALGMPEVSHNLTRINYGNRSWHEINPIKLPQYRMVYMWWICVLDPTMSEM